MNESLIHNPIEEVRMQILALRDEIGPMGGNDSEISNLDGLIKRLEAGKISPQDALSEARNIRSRKQDEFI